MASSVTWDDSQYPSHRNERNDEFMGYIEELRKLIGTQTLIVD